MNNHLKDTEIKKLLGQVNEVTSICNQIEWAKITKKNCFSEQLHITLSFALKGSNDFMAECQTWQQN